MTPWLANALGILIVGGFVALLALALLWRVGSWSFSSAASLIHDEGLPLGTRAPELAARRGAQDYHLSFHGLYSFLAFGKKGCEPCMGILEAASSHPVTRDKRLVYISDAEDIDVDPGVAGRWERYEFYDEPHARELWRVPVIPYFYLIGPDGLVIDKGIASHVSHLDRLLKVGPFPTHAGHRTDALEVGHG